MPITVREATPADAATLVAHLRELAAEPGIDIPLAPDEVISVEQEKHVLEEFSRSPRAIMLIAQAGGQLVDPAGRSESGPLLVGELSLRAISPRRSVSHVATLGMSVKQAWRRKGVGRELLTAALEWAPTAGITRVELYVYARNTAAIRLYEQLGFEHEGRRKGFIREGDAFLDDLIMARLL